MRPWITIGRSRALVTPICIALGVAAASAADNWPHFRFNGGVVQDDPRLPDRWSATENVCIRTRWAK
jgi:hypothetical protein